MSRRATFTESELQAARETLTAFVWERAEVTRARAGVDWVFTPDAPNTYTELRQAWEVSLSTGAPLPVLNDHSESVIFTEPEGNFVYRYWHDVTHLERERNFSNPHELDMAMFHLWDAEQHGLSRGSLPWRLLHADAIGNVLHWSVYRDYVPDQRVFVENVVCFGLEAALLGEAARRGLFNPQVLPAGMDYQTGSICPSHPSHLAPSM
ncbi:hypothetical protein [Microbacterium sp. RURRCA19A]|uniref:hypothetical protein n=1 Tax=Microbacterium sp. RURRCA19A TaxID=1907391 RepID=UPI000954524F|nr:hypothetical protein [Microbacterium sp. RURRCA19A]SIS17840.1 hypothetical protein SAMN05880568_3298 [Microbacterium sp. RURRCA19A]